MALYTIDCQRYILNGTQKSLGSEKTVETDNGEIHATFVIKCDGKDDVFSFNTEYYGDDIMEVTVNRCNIEVYIKENRRPSDKRFTIRCTHSNDIDTFIEIVIIQKAEDFKVQITGGASLNSSTDRYEKTLKSLITVPAKTREDGNYSNYDYYEEVEIGLNVVGGSKRYRIESILKCHEEDGETIYRKFDNGFVYNKCSDKLVVRNYGRPFLNESDYYLLRLSHEDNSEITIELALYYSKVTASSSRNLLKSNKLSKKNKVLPQKSDIYLIDSNNIEQDHADMVEKDVYEIRFTQEIGDELVIENDYSETVIPFEVYKNGEPSDLMVRGYTSAAWCTANTDSTNRNLLIKIYDKPISDRKSYVKVSIVDYPEVYASFILKNIKR